MAVPLAVTLLASCALPVAAADRATTRDGLYVTDEGAYGVYVIWNNPGSVGIAKCYLDTLPADYTVPAHVPFNGVQVPVRWITHYAFENHPEIETFRVGRNISFFSGDPLKGCTGITKMYIAGDPIYGSIGSSVLYGNLPQFVEVKQPKGGSKMGYPTDYIDIELSTKDVSKDGKLAVTCTLHSDVNNFVANLYTTNLEYLSMSPMDEGAEPIESGPAFLRLGRDPERDDDYGRTRTFYYKALEGRNPSINVMASVLDPEAPGNWVALDSMVYCLPNNPTPDASTPDAYPAYLPLPADVAPMQEATLEGTNAIRAQVGAVPLELSNILNEAAMVRATEMALAEEREHTRPDGSSCLTVLTGYGTAKGENIVMPGTGRADQVAPTSVELWRNSPGHYKNMVNTAYRSMGVGYAQSRSGAWYGCQLFSDTGRGSTGGGPAMYSIDDVKVRAPYTPSGAGDPSSPTTPGASDPDASIDLSRLCQALSCPRTWPGRKRMVPAMSCI